MANPIKGEVAFTANGAEYTLLFDFNALCEIEEEFGVSVTAIGDLLAGDNVKVTDIRRMFRIGLLRHHEGATLEETGDIITEVGPAKAGALIQEAFTKAFPAEVADKGTSRPRKR
jgi:hypothetical protein